MSNPNVPTPPKDDPPTRTGPDPTPVYVVPQPEADPFDPAKPPELVHPPHRTKEGRELFAKAHKQAVEWSKAKYQDATDWRASGHMEGDVEKCDIASHSTKQRIPEDTWNPQPKK